jgi:formylglycine-generating enzyme required for sulfatase activity
VLRLAPLLLLLSFACTRSPPVGATAVPADLADGVAWTDPGTGHVWIGLARVDYLLGKAEVTVDDYRRCVEAGACTDEGLYGVEWKEMPLAPMHTCNWTAEGKGSHPINCIDWYQSHAFCRWVGGRLPTRREFHDAVMGTRGGLYPWGSAPATCDLAVMYDESVVAPVKGCGARGTMPVCSRPKGNSPDGVCDLAGNVWEWSDTRQIKGNADEPRYNMGGSWQNQARHLTHDFELVNPLAFRLDGLGLRCQREPGGSIR